MVGRLHKEETKEGLIHYPGGHRSRLEHPGTQYTTLGDTAQDWSIPGPNTLPWGTLLKTRAYWERIPSTTVH